MSELVARANAALDGVSAGPWRFAARGHWRGMVMTPAGCLWNPRQGEINDRRDGEFIVTARTLVPELAAELWKCYGTIASLHETIADLQNQAVS